VCEAGRQGEAVWQAVCGPQCACAVQVWCRQVVVAGSRCRWQVCSGGAV